MATIRKRIGRDGTTAYQVQVRRQGQPPTTRTFAKRRDAEEWGASQETAAVERRSFPTRLAERYTLGHAINRYREEELPRHKPGTRRIKVVKLDWWEAELGAVRLGELSSDHIIAKRALLASTLKAETVNSYLTHLAVVLRMAVRPWRWIATSPMVGVGKLPVPPGRVRFLSDDERARLLEACRLSTSPHLYPVVVLALSTGARKREILDLRWADIDWTRQRMTLNATKTGDRRSVPLTGLVERLLRERFDPHEEYIFPHFIDSRAAHTVYDAWDTARKRAGLKNFRFHDLRHTAASYLAMSGASLLDIAAILGHKRLEMTKRYAHLTTNHLGGVVERMTASIFK